VHVDVLRSGCDCHGVAGILASLSVAGSDCPIAGRDFSN
jgi:hypothetical protein